LRIAVPLLWPGKSAIRQKLDPAGYREGGHRESGRMIEPAHRFEVETSVANHFAWIRTQLGLQRTLMAAVRTGISLIGFGFTVAQVFEKMVNTPASGIP